MKKTTHDLIAELANDLQPGRHWHPAARTAFGGGLFFLVSLCGMLAYQSFRPNVTEQLFDYARFSIEILSAFLICNFLIYWVFAMMVPGRKGPALLYWIMGAAGLAWLATQGLAFESSSPPSSFVGARRYCVEEVLFYGLVGLGFLFYFVQKAFFPFKVWQYFLMGFVSGLVPGALMQLACLYDPKHGLLLHYGPALAIGLIAAIAFPFIQKIRSKNF